MLIAARLPLKIAPLALAVAAFALGACVLGPSVDPGLERAIKAHYAGHATEEEGHCRTPKIDTIQSHQTTGKSETGDDVMTVRYSYFDQQADMDTNWGALFHLSQPCGGIAEREFSLIRTELGYRVTAMAGEKRGGGNIN